ncbi:DUF2637 domain-containing protein [Streptomyces pratensis]|uniref:DUF2637 domain-containing protein n=1 Tax=Streptomyces pratensis TaxID=1169025 RepID=UPI00301603AF
MAAMQLTRTHRILIGVVVAGAVLIAAIGFAGSYAAVRELAEDKGFGSFSLVFPIGIDAGICVLLALDLLLTWMRIPFPLLRQTAWLLTAATIAFNGAASWPDPLGTAMHAVIPVLFVVSVEAARHAVGRIADITADKHMEGVRLTRWLLSPVPTFKLWRRMKLWELRSYEQVIKLEQDRLVYQARLQARFGRNWRRKAPVESMMPLRLAKYGVPLAETAPAGLAAAGIEPVLLPPVEAARPKPELDYAPQREHERERPHESDSGRPHGPGPEQDAGPEQTHPEQGPHTAAPHDQRPRPQSQAQPQPLPQAQPLPQSAAPAPAPEQQQPRTAAHAQAQPLPQPQPQAQPQRPGPAEQPYAPTHDSPWFAAQHLPDNAHESAYDPQYVEGFEPTPVPIPTGPGRPRAEQAGPPPATGATAAKEPAEIFPEDAPQQEEWSQEDQDYAQAAFEEFSAYTEGRSRHPSVMELDARLVETRDARHPRSTELLLSLMPKFEQAYAQESAMADRSA